jgi:hypothetical protein
MEILIEENGEIDGKINWRGWENKLMFKMKKLLEKLIEEGGEMAHLLLNPF